MLYIPYTLSLCKPDKCGHLVIHTILLPPPRISYCPWQPVTQTVQGEVMVDLCFHVFLNQALQQSNMGL